MKQTINKIEYEVTSSSGQTTVSWDTGSFASGLSEVDALEAVALKQVRLHRTEILRDSDWRDLPSYQGANQSEWRVYRQALRDLPSTYDGNDIELPTKP